MPNLANLDPLHDDGSVSMVVESPRGSAVKLKYNAKVKVFTIARALPVGTTYPFDWGFIPGTRGEDGDPLDALAIHDSPTFPGVLLPCRVLGLVDVSQKAKKGREKNPRFILMPDWNDRMGEFEEAAGLPQRLKEEIEQFFLNATFFTGKNARIEAWRGRQAAEKFIQSHRRESG